jgi:hypothetical protein
MMPATFSPRSIRSVAWFGMGAAIVSDNNSFLQYRPRKQIMVGGFAKTNLIGGNNVQAGNAAQEPAKDDLVEIVVDEEP